jgi:hypothetical protein
MNPLNMVARRAIAVKKMTDERDPEKAARRLIATQRPERGCRFRLH